MARDTIPEIVLGGQSMNGYLLVLRVGESFKVDGLTIVHPSRRGSAESLLRLENPICIGKISAASFDPESKSILASLEIDLSMIGAVKGL